MFYTVACWCHFLVFSKLALPLWLQTSEYIIQAYKYGAFEKIPEFIAFRNRLNNSLHFAQVRTERMLLDLFLEADLWVFFICTILHTCSFEYSYMKTVFFFYLQIVHLRGKCEVYVYLPWRRWHPMGQHKGQPWPYSLCQLESKRPVLNKKYYFQTFLSKYVFNVCVACLMILNMTVLTGLLSAPDYKVHALI